MGQILFKIESKDSKESDLYKIQSNLNEINLNNFVNLNYHTKFWYESNGLNFIKFCPKFLKKKKNYLKNSRSELFSAEKNLKPKITLQAGKKPIIIIIGSAKVGLHWSDFPIRES